MAIEQSQCVPFADITEQFCDGASFLWQERNRACESPHYGFQDLRQLDARLDAHLDGLSLTGREGWRLALDAWRQFPKPGEWFVLLRQFLCLHREGERVQPLDWIVERYLSDLTPEKIAATRCALHWAGHDQVRPLLAQLQQGDGVEGRLLALEGLADHHGLNEAANSAEMLWLLKRAEVHQYGRLLRLIAISKLSSCADFLMELATSDEIEVACPAVIALAHLQSEKIVDRLREYTDRCDSYGGCAREIWLQLVLPEESQAVMTMLSDGGREREFLHACRARGCTEDISSTLERMSDENLARLAGEAFSYVTGVDLYASNGLSCDPPQVWQERVTAEDNDPNHLFEGTASEYDQECPWPDAVAVAAWWKQHRDGFRDGQRYCGGLPVSEQCFATVVAQAYQRQRVWALESLRVGCVKPLHADVRWPAFRQQPGILCSS